MFPEEMTELKDAETENFGKIGPKTQRNLADLPMKKRFLRRIKEVLGPINMVEEWPGDICGCDFGEEITFYCEKGEKKNLKMWSDVIFCLSEVKEGNEW